MAWNEIALTHLRSLVEELKATGLEVHLQGVVQDLWRANVERYDPDALDDDNGTLGYTVSKNVTNRIFRELRTPNGALGTAATAIRSNQATVVKVGDARVHIVKARVDRGRRPRFTTDFRWENREGRIQAASRNFYAYAPPPSSDEHTQLFELPTPGAAERVKNCLDIFVVWAGEMDGRTAGWWGLPTLGNTPWLAVEQAWFDKDRSDAPGSRVRGPSLLDAAFSDIEPPRPKVALKSRTDERYNHG